jgi:hypothetical protein
MATIGCIPYTLYTPNFQRHHNIILLIVHPITVSPKYTPMNPPFNPHYPDFQDHLGYHVKFVIHPHEKSS